MWIKWLVAATTVCSLTVLMCRILSYPTAARVPVYAVVEVRAALKRDPDAWVNRTLLVRGVAEAVPCTPAPAGPPICPSQRLWLAAAGTASTRESLPLLLGTGNRLLATLRHIPLVGALAPGPQIVNLGAAATYRIQIRAASPGACPTPPCYTVVVLDAAL